MNIEKFIKEDLEIRVRVNNDGGLELSLEDVARGLGFEREKNNKMYVMWDRVGRYLEELSFHTSVEKPTTSPQVWKNIFIQEWVFYMLCMKAKNEKAKAFQLWISKEVLPSIRKNSFYIDNKNITDEQIRKMEMELLDLKQQRDNFSNGLLFSKSKRQGLKPFLEHCFPNCMNVYSQFLNNMVKSGMLNEDFTPTESFRKMNLKRKMFTHNLSTVVETKVDFVVTNKGMDELYRRLYVEEGVLKIKTYQPNIDNLKLF